MRPTALRVSRSASGRGSDAASRAVLVVVLGLLILLVGLPVQGVFAWALSEEGRAVLGSFFTSSVRQTLLTNTITLGLSVAALGTAAAFVLAYGQARIRFPGRRLVHLLCLVPIISPPFAVAAATIQLFGRRGIISWGIFGERTDLVYGLPGLTFVLALSCLPPAYLNLLGMLRGLDPAQEEAASSLGASRWRVFRTVTLPLLIPGFGGAFLLLFVEAISDLSNPLVLGGDFHVLASRAYLAITGEFNLARGAAFALVLMLPAVLVFAVQRYWASRGSHISITGRPSGGPQRERSPLVVVPALVVVYGTAGTILLLYGTIIAGAFLGQLGTVGSALAALRTGEPWGEAVAQIEPTVEHMAYVLSGAGNEAIFDTVRLALIATPIAGVSGMLTAWLVVTRLRIGAGLLDFFGMMGIAVPGTVIGIGYVIAYSTPTSLFGVPVLPQLVFGSAVFGGAAGIVMAYASGSSPAGQRAGISALSQIDPALEEASASLGARTGETLRRITLPLIRPALLTGLMYAFAQAMTSVSAVIFLQTSQISILTLQIYTETERARYGNAFAFCVVLMGIVLTAMLLIHLVTRRMQGVRT